MLLKNLVIVFIIYFFSIKQILADTHRINKAILMKNVKKI